MSMYVPKYIQRAIQISAESYKKSSLNDKILFEWLELHCADVENSTLCDMHNDCIVNGTEQAEEFIQYLQDMEVKKAVKK